MQTNALRWIQLSLVYFCIAVALGCWMGATHRFQLSPVHAHLNLLGWVTMALTGMLYHHFPAAAASRLASWHFRVYNAALPVMMLALALMLSGNAGMEPVVGMASLVLMASIGLFALNIWRNALPIAITPRPAAATAGAPTT